MRKPGTHERFIIYRGGKTVAEGIEFSDGTVAVRTCDEDKPRLFTAYATIADAEEAEIPDDRTQFVWDF